jgi:hypothetical protein
MALSLGASSNANAPCLLLIQLTRRTADVIHHGKPQALQPWQQREHFDPTSLVLTCDGWHGGTTNA